MTQKGWKGAGIQCFNTLCQMVKKDRKDNSAVVWGGQMLHITKQNDGEGDEITSSTSAFH